MKEKINVSAVQMRIEPNDITANLKTVEKSVRKIFQKHKTDLIVFPENCITGPIPDRLDLVQDENSDSIKFFRKLAKQYDTHIVCGSFIKKSENKYYKTSLLINNNGAVILEYQKNNLWHSEKQYLSPGNNIECAKTSIGNIGIIICSDMDSSDISNKLRELGADIICCPSFWAQHHAIKPPNVNAEKLANSICRSWAVKNQAIFIFANGAGIVNYPRETHALKAELIGQTQICTPRAGTVSRLDNNNEGSITYSVKPKLF